MPLPFQKNSIRLFITSVQRVQELRPQEVEAQRNFNKIKGTSDYEKQLRGKASGALHQVQSEIDQELEKQAALIAAISPKLDFIENSMELVKVIRDTIR